MKQTFGTPIDAKILPIIATFDMDDRLDRIIPTIPFELFFFKKYLDDIIISLLERYLNYWTYHKKKEIQSREIDEDQSFEDLRLIFSSEIS